MWLRYRAWNQISDQEELRKMTGPNGTRSYLFWKKDEGLCDVRDRDDIYFLLNPPDGRPRQVEIATEKYGFIFDEKGNQVELPMASSTNLEEEDNGHFVTVSETSLDSSKKRAGRPKGSKNKARAIRAR